MTASTKRVSEFFKITGNAPWCDGSDQVQNSSSYSINSLRPVSCEVTASWKSPYDEDESSPSKEYTISSNAQSFKVEAKDNSCDIFTMATAMAETQYVFHPLVNNIKLTFNGSVDPHEFENKVQFKLEEVYRRNVLGRKTWTTTPDDISPFTQRQIFTYVVKPKMKYRLTLTAVVHCGDNPGAYSLLEVDITGDSIFHKSPIE